MCLFLNLFAWVAKPSVYTSPHVSVHPISVPSINRVSHLSINSGIWIWQTLERHENTVCHLKNQKIMIKPRSTDFLGLKSKAIGLCHMWYNVTKHVAVEILHNSSRIAPQLERLGPPDAFLAAIEAASNVNLLEVMIVQLADPVERQVTASGGEIWGNQARVQDLQGYMICVYIYTYDTIIYIILC